MKGGKESLRGDRRKVNNRKRRSKIKNKVSIRGRKEDNHIKRGNVGKGKRQRGIMYACM